MDSSAPQPLVPTHAPFDLYGPATPDRPVILSVPHAGRDYPPGLLAQARVRPEMLRRLEDRWVDLLAETVIARGFTVLVARAPRAMIDLNRNEREIDPVMLRDLPHGVALQSSAKLRGGLGLLPRRMPGAHELWRGPLAWAEVQQRIEQVHRPYHATITRLMQAAQAAHGHAILIDLHSMPPLPPPAAGQRAPGMVLGDRFGRSASSRLIALIADIADAHGVATAQNHPYAGDHLLERHGRPGQGYHAVQVEIDRALYLDATLDRLGPGVERMRALVTDMVEALARELPREDYALAAE
ncbi:N-formylglutamate amidohydrolase [Sphingobium lactosutens]|uniref:N-formylglutamate amidohydrolase n=1 Tax=Sphingobium lactosutens TaxID=522773 RepID=UPI0015BEF059|nr:N-formylglutamate amidohydrolase [Sphingobium lactosutens]NWK97142.1 N-formylglutamate amidohydrolase [Sphingobium lactosutens]